MTGENLVLDIPPKEAAAILRRSIPLKPVADWADGSSSSGGRVLVFEDFFFRTMCKHTLVAMFTMVDGMTHLRLAACGGKFYIAGFFSFGANDAFLSLARDAFEGHIVGSDCGP